MVVGGGKYQYVYLHFFGHKIVIFFSFDEKKNSVQRLYRQVQEHNTQVDMKQEARLIFYLTYLYEQMILVPPHCTLHCIMGQKHFTQSQQRRMEVLCAYVYNILHTSKQLNVQQPTRGWGVLSDKVLFTPSEKRSSPEVGFFLELCNLCVTYAQHDSLSLFERFLFFFFFIHRNSWKLFLEQCSEIYQFCYFTLGSPKKRSELRLNQYC